MRLIHTAPSIFEINKIRVLVEEAGIACVVRNEKVATLMGEIGFVNVWPELHVLDHAEYDQAKAVTESFIAKKSVHQKAGEIWTCASCGETSEGQFDACWNCSSPAPNKTKVDHS